MPSQPEDRSAIAPARDVYSVTRLTREVRALLERGLGVVWVAGELSNLSQPASGHWYFSLKDRGAQLRCVMFRMQNSLVGFTPRAGAQVLVRGRISVYEARGEYQLIVEHLEEAGIGALRREFERLKTRLAAEGLFALERKRSLPRFPQRIGVITSPSGAALRDILQILARRYPPAAVLIYPAPVQGAAAAAALVAALESASRRAECDVLIVARGGGSLEDLWAFNDERLARAIHAASRPVVSGVGHEIDFTIADLVADARAPTPSAAAELVVPERGALLAALERTHQRLAWCVRRELQVLGARLAGTERRLSLAHPGLRLQQQMQRLDELTQRLSGAARAGLHHAPAAVSREWRAPDAPLAAAACCRRSARVLSGAARTAAAARARRERACGTRAAPPGSRRACARRREPSGHARARLRHRDRPGGRAAHGRGGGAHRR